LQRSAARQHFASRCQDKPVNECKQHPVEEKKATKINQSVGTFF
jgi:hypothetical protein